MPGELGARPPSVLETELHRTIRGGADFHLAEEMNEMAELQDANRVMRDRLRKDRQNAAKREARRQKRRL